MYACSFVVNEKYCMMRFFGLLPFIFIFELALGQSPCKPIIVTLDPFIKKYDSASSREIAHYDSVHTAYQEPDMVGFGTDIKKEAILDSLHKKFQIVNVFFFDPYPWYSQRQ